MGDMEQTEDTKENVLLLHKLYKAFAPLNDSTADININTHNIENTTDTLKTQTLDVHTATDFDSNNCFQQFDLLDIPVILEQQLDENLEIIEVEELPSASPSLDNRSVTQNYIEASAPPSQRSQITSRHSSIIPKKEKSLRDFIIFPVTPERKNIKNTEKLPFVLTSTTWKQIHLEKIWKKYELKQRKRIEK